MRMLTSETMEGAEVARAGLRGELRAMARLALPVVLVQVGMLAMGAVDTAIVGRLPYELRVVELTGGETAELDGRRRACACTR